jgi:phosphatidate cytidylyltransferase
VSMVAVVKAGDIAAYVAGSLVGATKMAPVLSPGKTWEGAVASLIGSAAAAWLVLTGLQGTGLGLAVPAQPWGGWLAFGLLVGGAGMLGDLAESLIKREAGAKDSGHSLGGLGGVLDLVDSLLFAAPVAWALWAAGLAAS